MHAHYRPASITSQSPPCASFFFKVKLERRDLVRRLTLVGQPREASVMLGQEEVALLLRAAPGLTYKAGLKVACGGGLRVRVFGGLFALAGRG